MVVRPKVHYFTWNWAINSNPENGELNLPDCVVNFHWIQARISCCQQTGPKRHAAYTNQVHDSHIIRGSHTARLERAGADARNHKRRPILRFVDRRNCNHEQQVRVVRHRRQ